MQLPELLSTAEAAGVLGVDRSTITRWVAAGHLRPAFQPSGERAPMYFKASDIHELKTQTVVVTRRRFNTEAAS